MFCSYFSIKDKEGRIEAPGRRAPKESIGNMTQTTLLRFRLLGWATIKHWLHMTRMSLYQFLPSIEWGMTKHWLYDAFIYIPAANQGIDDAV